MDDPAITPIAGVVFSDEISLDRLREMQRFAELGRLSASLLHEISNPLTAAILHLEQYGNRQSSSIRHARRNIQLLQRYVEAARQQVRQESPAISFYVRPELHQVKRILMPLARRGHVKLRIETAANYKLFGDPVKFQQIVANLVRNAIDAYDNGSFADDNQTVLVTLSSRQQWIIIRVTDRGSGITAQQLPHVFEPFYTTKGQAGHGLGIGLTAVKQYVETDFHGSIGVLSSPKHGTQFTVRLRITPRYGGKPTSR